MKIEYVILAFLILTNCKCFSQITTDYPFKTYLDSTNNLYITGNKINELTNSIDILTEKYNSSGDLIWTDCFPNLFGNDRGLDLAVDKNGNTYVAGFIFNYQTNSNDIILIKYNSAGLYQWDKIYLNSDDDKALGVDITIQPNGNAQKIFITGYISRPTFGTDIVVKEYNAIGDSLWQSIYSSRGDDAATDIKVQGDYINIIGYTYQGDINKDDITFINYNKLTYEREVVVHNIAGSNEKPTDFQLLDLLAAQNAKSRSVVAGISDNFSNGNNSFTNYITLFFEPDVNQHTVLKWNNYFRNGPHSKDNVATSIALDVSNDVLTTGYVYNYDNEYQSNGLDFATVKYSKETGNAKWVKYYNFSDTSTAGNDDKASSMKVNDSNHIYIAGMSDASPFGFSIVKYKQQTSGKPKKQFDQSYIPVFLNYFSNESKLNKWATIQLAYDGTPMLIVMAWDENQAHWSARKYDSNLNEEYTINPETNLQSNRQATQNGKQTENPERTNLRQNYPNPFNPNTVINYEVKNQSHISLKVYDVSGKEVMTLADQIQTKGNSSVTFDGSNLSSGIYFYKLVVSGANPLISGDAVIDTKTMLLVK